MSAYDREVKRSFAEEAVLSEVKRRVREKIQSEINPMIDEFVDDICKNVSGEAVIEKDMVNLRDILVLAVKNKK